MVDETLLIGDTVNTVNTALILTLSILALRILFTCPCVFSGMP